MVNEIVIGEGPFLNGDLDHNEVNFRKQELTKEERMKEFGMRLQSEKEIFRKGRRLTRGRNYRNAP